MQDSDIARQKTAIKRHRYSRPINTAIRDGIITQNKTLFDYGCGHGDDIALLKKIGIQSAGWDPGHNTSTTPQPADIVNLGYVVNVIEDENERRQTLRKAWKLAQEILIVSAQLTIDAKTKTAVQFKDGYLTKRGTFQKYFEQQELRTWITSILGKNAVAAAPGIFYVFQDQELKETFINSRYRRRTAVPRLRKTDELFERHRDILQPLMAFFADRGRMPGDTEIAETAAIRNAFGSIKNAFRVVRVVTETERWGQITDERSQDLLLYLALARFDGRPRFSKLPQHLQFDIKAFFSTYKRACELSDALLFGCGNQDLIDQSCAESSVGKLTPNALYVHASALKELSTMLRVYESCAESYVGKVEGVNIVKLHRKGPKISYLSYPDFEKDPHPALMRSFSVNLQTFRIRQISYAESSNPPILHRKELFLPENHDLHDKFARLTRSEERAGLFDHASNIGRATEWNDLVMGKGLYLRGHRLLKIKDAH